MYDLLKASAQLLNSLFNYTANRDKVVLWIRSNDYERQVFISDNFETLWQTSCESLYETPDRWKECLLPEDVQRISPQESSRITNLSPHITDNLYFYRIIDAKSEVQYVKDWCVPLLHENQTMAIVGAAETLSPEQWHDEFNKSLNAKMTDNLITPARYDFMDILSREFQLNAINQQSIMTSMTMERVQHFQKIIQAATGCLLTPRELEGCYYLCQGNTSKEIARIMDISYRTVEKYLDTARKKSNTSRRGALINKISKYFTSN